MNIASGLRMKSWLRPLSGMNYGRINSFLLTFGRCKISTEMKSDPVSVLMRSREFVMKDAYSFDVDREGMIKSYESMYDAYSRIFTECGIEYRSRSGRTRVKSAEITVMSSWPLPRRAKRM